MDLVVGRHDAHCGKPARPRVALRPTGGRNVTRATRPRRDTLETMSAADLPPDFFDRPLADVDPRSPTSSPGSWAASSARSR